MTKQLKMYRLRAGFYVTRDGEYRIVRRSPRVGAPKMWSIEVWSAGEHRWIWITRRQTLRNARAWLNSLIEARTADE